MKNSSLRPLFDNRNLWKPFFWDDEDWPEYKMTDGLNVYEEENEVGVEAAVPGIDAKDIKVTYEDGILRIQGRSEDKSEEKNKERTIHQWNKVSSFEYTTYLPRPIDSSSIEAKVKNGVIKVSAKVAEEAKSREIEVKVE